MARRLGEARLLLLWLKLLPFCCHAGMVLAWSAGDQLSA